MGRGLGASGGAPADLKITFVADTGPELGTLRLLTKTPDGFVVPPTTDINAILGKSSAGPMDGGRLCEGLAVVARALNNGDIALAAIATAQLRLKPNDSCLRKAAVDDPKRPGWPAKTPGSLGGKFRPKDGSFIITPSDIAERAGKIERLKARRGIRAVLRRVLTAKRLARLFLEGLGEAIPGLDVVDTVALAEDIAEIAGEVAEGNAEVDVAVAFVEKGPQAIEDLLVSAEDETFPSFEAFKKIDLEKRFGPAGEGYEYHHIVEQSAGLDGISAAELNSTGNIVRIPKLLHEEINAMFGSTQAGAGMTMRQLLKGQSLAARRAAGLDVLRKVGVLVP